MPEASMNEDDGLMLREYDVWFAYHVLAIDPETKPKAMQRSPNDQLGFRVAATNAPHHF